MSVVNYEEMCKAASAKADAILEQDHFVPAFVKSAVANGAPEPRTEDDLSAMLDTVKIMLDAKQAYAQGAYPELREQFVNDSSFEAVRNMAKRAKDALDETYSGPQVNPELYAAATEYATAQRAAQQQQQGIAS
jgi:hypothetical protein